MLARGSPLLTPKFCIPVQGGMLCSACPSDAPLQGCPCVLVIPWPSGYLQGTGDGLPVSSVSPHPQDLYIHSETSSAFRGSWWTQGAALVQVYWQNSHARRFLAESTFPSVQIGTSISKKITAVTKGTLWTWLEAPSSATIFADMIVLFLSIFLFPIG